MNDNFNPDQYRENLRKKFGIKGTLPLQSAVGYVDKQTSAVNVDPSNFGGDGGGESIVSPQSIDNQQSDDSDVLSNNDNNEVNEEQIAPAMGLLNTLIQSVKEQSQTAQDQVSGVMWNSLHNYIWKNRNKIAKKMMDDAQ